MITRAKLGDRLRVLRAFASRNRVSLAAFLAIVAVLAGTSMWLLAPSHEVATYTFTNRATPVALGRLDKTPVEATVAGNSVTARLANDVAVDHRPAAKDSYMAIKHGGAQLRFRMAGAQELAAQSSGSTVTYPSIRPDTDVTYHYYKDYVKEDITAKTAEAANGVSFYISKKDGVSLRKDGAKGIIGSKNGRDTFYLHPPSAKDTAGKTIGYQYALHDSGADYRLYVMPDRPSDLRDAVFPVVIDPTVSWSFENDAPYFLSDPSKIEVAGGVLRLVNNNGSYATDNPYAVTNSPVAYTALSGFSEALGANNQGAVRYQLSRNGNAWYYWNGSAWVSAAATDYNQANPASTVNGQMGAFASQFGAGSVYVKAFLHANSASTPAELQSFSVDYTAPNGPTLSGISPSSGSYQGGTSVTLTGANLTAAWPYQKKITVDETKIPGSQTLQDYPLLVSRTDPELRAAANGGRVAKTNGGDIRFTLPNGTKLDHEIEKYDPATGQLIAWVRIPYLSATTNTELWMQYGNASASNQWNNAGTWGPNYKAVYHLADANPNDTFTTLDTTKWGTFGTVALNTGRVQLNVGNTAQWSSSGLASMANGPQFSGDFDAQIDFDVSAWTTTVPSDAHEIAFQLFNTNADGTAQSGNAYYVVYQKAAGGGRAFGTWQDETDAGFGTRSTTLTTTSKLRFTRSGNTITAYGYDANAWVAIGSFTSANAGKRMAFNIYASNRTSGTTVPAAYLDNFTVSLGAPIKDSTSNSNLAWNAGTTASPTNGKIGLGYYFNGTATSYIQIPNSASLENIQENTYSMLSWYNPASVPAAGADDAYAVLMKDGYHGGIRYNTGSTFTMDHWLAGATPTSGSATTSGTYSTGATHMVAGTVDRAAGQTKIYADGTPAAASFAPDATTYEYGQQPWRIAIARPGAASYRWLARGTIDEVRLLDTKLSDAFVAAEYNNHNAPDAFYSVGTEEPAIRVSIGGTAATNVKVVGSTTVTATTPTHSTGTFDVTVISADGQTATLPGAYTFTTPLATPGVSGITPSSGVSTGGTAVTVSGSNFVPANSWSGGNWSNPGNTGVSVYNPMVYVVGDKIYRAGGMTSGSAFVNTIYSAPVSDPTTWTNTGKTLPTSMASAGIAIIGDYVYAFGGDSGTVRNFIHRAPLSDPANWSLVSGKTLPTSISNTALAIIGDRVYMFGGYSSSTTTSTAIQSAPLSDPTSWTSAAKSLPTNLAGSHLIVTETSLYLVGGYRTSTSSNLNTIYTASKSDPLTWGNAGKSFPTGLRSGSVVTIGDYAYILGGVPTGTSTPANTIYRAPLSDLATWTLQPETLFAGLSSSVPLVVGDNVYLINGYIAAATSNIYRSAVTSHPRANAYMNPWQTDWVTSSTDLTSVKINGLPLTDLKVVDSSTMTGVTAASSQGTYDVLVTNYDGQTATLPGAFTYFNRPSVSAINPSSVVNTGGDTVTITGADFRGTMTVVFDGIPGTNVQVVNENTITVTAPAHPSGAASVVVSNEYGSDTYTGFSYRHPAPVAEGVSPAFGPVSGGTSVTISGQRFTPPNTGGTSGWTNTNLPYAIGIQQLAVVGDYVYMYGGYQGGNAVNMIYRAPVSDPTTWTNTGKTLPATLSHSQVAVIGDYVYLFGGLRSGAGVNNIYRAPVSDPSAMVDTGKTIPAGLAASQLAVVGNDLYLIGGYTTVPVNVIYKSTVADPLTWTNTGKTLPAVNSHSQLAVLGDKMYLFGGYGTGATAVNSIFTANTSDPTTWSLVSGKTLPSAWAWSSLAVIGNDLYLLGGYNNSGYVGTIYKSTVADPTTWTNTGVATPGASTFGSVALIGDYVYLFGGYQANAQGYLQRAPIQRNRHTNTYMKPWQTSWPTAPDQTSVTVGGAALSDLAFTDGTAITGTTAPHASGQVDVTVRNYDGQESTLADSFQYLEPPTISAVTPGSAGSSGGDTVTITGSNFGGTLSIAFGGVPATSFTVVNPTTITAVVPAHTPGAVGIVIANELGTTRYDGFRYISTPPTVTSVNPNSGPSSGGTDITVTGTGFLPQNTGGSASWATVAAKTLPAAISQYDSIVLDGYIYIFGGYNQATSAWSNTIFRAPVSDPTAWTNTGKTLPATVGGTGRSLVRVGSYLYILDGNQTDNGGYVLRAPVSDPTAWTNTGARLPGIAVVNQAAVIGDYVYAFGGWVTGSTYTGKILRAPVSDPTAWTDTGKTLPGASYLSQFVVTSSDIYMIGGTNGAMQNSIWKSTVSDPTTWTNTGKTFPSTIGYGAQAVVGGYMYIFGGSAAGAYSNKIWRAPLSDLTTWTDTGSTVPYTGGLGTAMLLGDYVYVFGGYAGSARTNAIYRAPVQHYRQNLYHPSIHTDWGTLTADQTGVTIGGVAATNVQVVNATTMTATTAANTKGVKDVTVVSDDGASASLPASFTHYNAPSIVSLTPNTTTIAGGDTITITGADFQDGATVSLNGVGATATFVDANTLTFVMPSLPSGTVNVTVINPDGQSVTANAAITVQAVIDRIGFATAPATLRPGGTAKVIVQTQDYMGRPLAAEADTVVQLAALSGGNPSATGGFSLSKTDWQTISQVTIPGGQHSAELYYREANAGTYTLSASEEPSSGWGDASKQVVVSADAPHTWPFDEAAEYVYDPSKIEVSGGMARLKDTTTFDRGTGDDGAATVSGTKNINADSITPGRTCADGVNYSVTALTATTATLSAAPAAGCLAPGDEMLLVSQQGTSSAYANVGNYEFVRVASVSGTTVTFKAAKQNYYGNAADSDAGLGTTSTTQRVMLQRVPNYTTLSVPSGATLTADAWNGTKGGILAFRAYATTTIDGTVTMAGKGYRGGTGNTVPGEGQFGPGAYAGESYAGTGYQTRSAGGANFNGGGTGQTSTNWAVNQNGGGGAGGGYGATGSNGSTSTSGHAGGAGGQVAGDPFVSGKLYLGGGGGGGGQGVWGAGGDGASGGGSIFMSAATVAVSGSVSTNGNAGGIANSNASHEGGGGGGGAGGAVMVVGQTVDFGANKVTSGGGSGGNKLYGGGDGGSGAVGRIALHATYQAPVGSTAPAYAHKGYATDNPVITPTADTSIAYTKLTSFAEARGSAPFQGSVRYQLSPDKGTNWYWYNGTAWAQATGASYAQATSAAAINAVIGTFDSEVGEGDLLIRAFLHADSPSSPVELDGVSVGYDQTPQNPASLTGIDPASGPVDGGNTVTLAGTGFMSEYHRAITVTNTGAPKTNTTEIIKLNTADLVSAGKLRSDCRDFRVLDSDESTVLTFAVVSGCNTTNTAVAVRFASLPAGEKTIYLNYGNSRKAAAGNLLSAFPILAPGSLNNWLRADAGHATVAGAAVPTVSDVGSVGGTWNQGTASKRPTYQENVANGWPVFRFDGSDDQLDYSGAAITNNFTAFAVARPTTSHGIDAQSGSGTEGIAGQRYLFGVPQYLSGAAGAGVSVGTNGVSVYEHAESYMPPLAVYSGTVTGFTSIGVQYNNRQPSIYTNGTLRTTGVTSSKNPVYWSTSLGCGNYGCWPGDVAEYLSFNAALSDANRKEVETYLNAKYNLYSSELPAALGDERNLMTVDFGTERGTVTATTATTAQVTVPHGTQLGKVDVKLTGVDGSTASLTHAYRYYPSRYAVIAAPSSLKELEPGTVQVAAQDMQGNSYMMDQDTTLGLGSSADTGFFAIDLEENIQTRWDYNNVVFRAGTNAAAFYYRDNAKGSPTVTISPPATETTVPATWQPNITSRYRFLVTGVSDPVKSGIPSSVTIQAVDYDGQPLHDYKGTVHFTSSDGAAIVPPDSEITEDMLGGKTFVNGVTMVTEGEWCVTVTDTLDPDITGEQCAITTNAPNEGTIAKLAFITPPQNFAATSQSGVITVQTQDATGAPIPATADTTLYVYSNSGTGLLSADGSTNWAASPLQVTLRAGTTSASFYYKDTTLGAHKLTVRDDEGTGPDFGWTDATQTIGVGVGGAYRIKITAPAGPFVAGQASQAFHATLQDELGNEVPVFSPQTIWITGSGAADLLSPTTDFDADAVSRLPLVIQPGDTGADFYYRDSSAGNRTITASDSDPANGDVGLLDDQVAITVGGAEASQIAFASAPFELVAGATSGTITAELRDSLGNRTTAQTDTTVYLYAEYPGAEFRSSDGTAVISSLIIPTGQSSASFRLKQTSFRAYQAITLSDNATAADGIAGLDDSSQTEVITAGSPAKLAITSPTPPETAVGTAVGPVTVTLQNQYNVAIPATNELLLNLRSTSAGGGFALDSQGPWTATLSPSLTVGSDSLNFYYRDTRAGTATITAADESSGADTGLTNATQTMTFIAGPPARVSITSAPQSLQAGQTSGVMTVRLEDQYGNPVTAAADQSVTLSTNAAYGRFDSNGAGAFSSNTITRTINAGAQTTTFYYRDYAAGTPLITATATGLTSGSQTQTITWGAVIRIDLTGQTSALAGEAAGPLTAYIYNTYNVNVPSIGTTTINLSSNNATGRFDTSAGGSFDGSVTSMEIAPGAFSSTVYYRGTQAGSHVLSAASGSMNDTHTINVGAAAADHLRVTTSPQTLQLGQVSGAITVRAEDAYGNATTVSAATTLNLSTTSATGQFRASSGGSPVSSVILGSGSSSANLYYVDYETGSPVLTVSTSTFGDITQTQTIIAGAPARFYFWADGATLTAGEPKQAYVFTANAYGQIVPATGDTTVSLTTNSATGRFDLAADGAFAGGSLTVTIPNGQTNAGFYYRDTNAGGVRLTAARTGYTSGTYDFNINAAAPYRIAFTNPVRTATAGATSPLLTLTLYDAYGNVAIASSPIYVSVTNSEPTAKFSPNGSAPWYATGSFTPTIGVGQSSYNFYYQDTVAGTKTITASSGGLVGATQSTTVNPAGFHHIGFASQPQTIVVQNPSAPFVLTGYDQFGNQRSMPSMVINLTTGSPQGSFSLSNTAWSPVSSLSIGTGTDSRTFYYKDGRLADTVITATPLTTYAAASQAVTIVAGNVTDVRFTSAQQTVITGTPSRPIAVSLTDANGYPSPSGEEVSVVLSSDSPTGQYSLDGIDGWTDTLTLTYQPGDTVRQVYFRDNTEGTVTMTASATGLNSGSQPITVIPGVIAKLGIVADSTATAGVAIPVTVQTLTGDGLGAAVAANTTVPLTATNGGQFSLNDTTWQPVTSVTIPAGQYQRTLYYRNTASGTDTLTARAPGGSGWTDGQATVAVGAGTYVKLAFLTLPASMNAGSPSGQMVVQARDQYGNATLPAADQTLYLYGPAEGQFATDVAGPWDATSVVMSAGTGTATFYYNDATPGSKTLRVSDKSPLDDPDQDIQNAVGQIAVASLPPSQLRFKTPQRTVVAGERSQVITIEAAQANGDRAIVGSPLQINLATTRLDGEFYASADATEPLAQVTLPIGGSEVNVYYRAETAGTATMSASATGLTRAEQPITVTAAAAHHLSFISAPQSHVAGDTSGQIIIQLQDEFNNAATNDQPVNIGLATDSLTGQFSLQTGSNWDVVTTALLPADTSELTVYYRDTTSGSWTLTASSADVAAGTQPYTIGAGNAVQLRFATPAQSLVAGQPSGAVTVMLADEFGNAALTGSDLTVFLGSTSAQASFSTTNDFAENITSVTIPVGSSVASFYFRDRAAGSPVITAADLALPDNPDLGLRNATQQQSISAGSPDHLAWVASASGVAGQVVPVRVELQNVYGVPVAASSDVQVYLGSTSGSGAFAMASNMAALVTEVTLPASSDHVDFYYRDTTAGAVTLSARDTQSGGEDVGILDASHDLTMLPEAAARLRIISSSQNLEAGETSNIMTVQIQDIFGNAVTATADASVYLASTSSGGSFATDSDFTQSVTRVSIVAGSSTASFYYRDPVVGTATVTAGDAALPESPDLGLANATQNVTITAGSITKLGWADVPAALEAGEVSAAVRIQAQNRFGIATPVPVDTTVYLEHTASDSGFATTPSGPWTLSQVTIPAGQKEVTVYYRNQAAASDTLTAADASPSSPDTGWSNGIATINVTAGEPVAIVFTNPARQTIARHTSAPYVIELRNRHGVAVPATRDTVVYLRSTTPSTSAEFSLNTAGPWGINYVTIPAGQSAARFYYHDIVVGTPTITASDNLPVTPDTGLTNASQGATIIKQVIDHFLVTNISTPQVQGTPSSVVVVAQDAENYIIDDYQGTITFTSSDSDAILPEPYTFRASDKSIHTFTNGVAFLREGLKSVTVTDQNGVTGTQYDIQVGKNTAGPIAGLQFTGVLPPLTMNADTATGPITVQAIDANGQAANAPDGGYQVRLTSSSGAGEYALSSDGPWSSTLVATIPAHLSSVNVYYRDTRVGDATLTAADWQGNTDDPGITNATLAVTVRALQVDVATSLQVNNNSHYYEPSTLIFAKNSNGQYSARSDFAITVKDKASGTQKAANLTLTWRSPGGSVLATQSVSNASSYTYHLEPIDGIVTTEGDYTLEVAAADPVSGVTGVTTVPVHISGWTMRIDYDPNNKSIGQPLPYTVSTFFNGVATDPANFTVNFRDDNGTDVPGAAYLQTLGDLTRTGVGVYAGSMPTTGLNATSETFENAYFLYGRIFDSGVNQTLAEDNHFDIFFQNNPALAPKNFAIEKIVTSDPAQSETYDLKFTWDASQYASTYVVYRSQNKNATLFTDPCTIDQIKAGKRYGDAGATTPFCETAIQQNVGDDDTTQWKEMARISAPSTSTTVNWSQLQADQPGSVYYYLVRAENGAGESGYSTMAVSVKKHFVTNATEGIGSVNWVALPYNATSYTNGAQTTAKLLKASDIVKNIEGATVGNAPNPRNRKINRVALWNPTNQAASSAYFYSTATNRWIGTDFEIAPGSGVYLSATYENGFDWTIVGTDQVQSLNLLSNDVGVSNVNWISIPYTSKYGKVSDVVKDIEGALTGTAGNERKRYIERVGVWGANTQNASTQYFYSTPLHRWTGADFEIKPGDGVYLQLSGGQLPLYWTPPLVINPYK
ncbi:MAG TPA: DUF2341 domain-containing protein [Candidatus Saccharimonadales bacterium]|nr:DUF2341 domain-containing protein [Candidatus Saccharimonadales bacterium]